MPDHVEIAAEATKRLTEKQQRFRKDPYRPTYHITAPYGWMNDPNGMIHYRGEYHLFYQLHPDDPAGGTKYWGHLKSRDLAHWEHLPVALAPSEPYDAGGCWSGTAVAHQGKLYLFYTGVAGDPPVQTVNLAVSSDGIRFEKHPANPVVPAPPLEGGLDCRDPKVWLHNGIWYMLLGTAHKGRARLALYRSLDLIHWIYLGIALESDGTKGAMWECPDFFRLGEKDVILVSPIGIGGEIQGSPLAVTGQMDYTAGKFLPERWQLLDHGPSFYAPQTWWDGQHRRILMGWMEKWGAAMPSQQYGWAGAMTIPRVMDLLPDGTIVLQPAPELTRLRYQHCRWVGLNVHPEGSGFLPELQGDAMEIIATFDLTNCTADRFGMKLRCSPDSRQETVVAFDRTTGLLEVDRSRSGAGDGGTYGGQLKASRLNRLQLHIFLDRSSLEVFGDHGRVSITQRIYPSPDSLGADLFAEGGTVHVVHLDTWRLGSAFPEE